MNVYVRIAVLAFAISLLLFLLSNLVATGQPWLGVQLRTKTLFACFASIYLPLTAGVMVQILQRHPPWSKLMIRAIAVPLLALTLGLFVSVAVAIFGDHGLSLDIYMRFLHVTDANWEQMHDLYFQAELLGMIKTFLECFKPITLSIGFSTVIFMVIYDIARENILKRKHAGLSG
jgi:hypothetical protein